jgi:hypothetical protein
VLEAGQTVSSADATDVDAVYSALYANLVERGVITWGSSDEVPDEAERPMVALLAAEIADDFHVDEPQYSRLQQEAWGPDTAKRLSAISQLYLLADPGYTSTQTEAEYF